MTNMKKVLPVRHEPHEVSVLSTGRSAISNYGDREIDLSTLTVTRRLTAGKESDGLAGRFGR
jgi:hypothetical protein